MGRYSGKKCRLVAMFSMTMSFFLVELLVGYITNSMALVADSFHMLSDVLALIIAFLSIKMSPKKWSKNTFGWARAEVLGALVNSVFLIALCFSIFVESLKRLSEVEELHNPQLILIVGVLGLLINVVGLLLFQEHGHGHSHGNGHGHSHGGYSTRHSTINALVATDDNENDERFQPLPPTISVVSSDDSESARRKEGPGVSQLNMQGVFLHILSDALGSVVVIISALVVWLTNWEYAAYIDPALSLCLVVLITASTWPVLKKSAMILLQTVPTHIQVEGIQKQLINIDGVLAVHEFHVWQLAGERIIASAHIRCRNLKDYMVIAEKIKKLFHEEGIHSTTIQPEFVEIDHEESTSTSINSAEDCMLDCPTGDKEGCAANTCCGIAKQVSPHNSGAVNRAMDMDVREWDARANSERIDGVMTRVRSREGSITGPNGFSKPMRDNYIDNFTHMRGNWGSFDRNTSTVLSISQGVRGEGGCTCGNQANDPKSLVTSSDVDASRFAPSDWSSFSNRL